MSLYRTIYEELVKVIQASEAGEFFMTEKGLCEKYGVSRATAGRVLGNLYKDGLVYRRPRLGTFIARSKSGRKIAVVLPYEESNNFKIMDSIIENNTGFGYVVDVFYSHSNRANEKAILNQIISKQYDGVMFLPSTDSDNLEQLSRLCIEKTPLLLLDFEVIGFDLPIVVSDNEYGEYTLVTSYLAKGLTKFIFVNANLSMPDTVKERFRGFCKALVEHGIRLSNQSYMGWNFEKSYAYSSKKTLFQPCDKLYDQLLTVLKNPMTCPEVICFANDASAAQFIQFVNEHGVKLTRKTIITGFDNIEPSAEYNFSTVEQNFTAIGKTALVVLDRLIQGLPVDLKTVIKTKLVFRE